MRDAIAHVLVILGVVVELGAVAGTVVMRDAYERLHYAGPASVGALVIAVAVLVEAGPSTIALKAGILAVLLMVVSPVLAHFTARAIREWDRGDWRPSADEIEDRGGG
jgi:monovalent cation/proton antiporter MnhG/PhaG subunit